MSSRLSPSPSSALNVWRATLFLFFRDIALLLGALALWTENPLLASLPAVGLALPQLLWRLDFLTGARISGMTSYMFDPKYSLFVRGLSSFHGWLPFLLLWMVWRLGYDRRALLGWTVVSSCVLLASFFLAPAPPAPADNPNLAVNLIYVHGLSYDKPRTVMPPLLWPGIMLAGFPVVFYLPTHLALSAWFPGEGTGRWAMTASCHQPRATRGALPVADSGSDRYCQRTFFEVRSQSSLTRRPVSSEVWTTSRSVGVSQALDRRSDSSAVSGSLTY